MKNKIKNVVAILFFLFFTTPILSPSFRGITIYLHWFIPFLDPEFIRYLFERKIKKKYILFFAIFFLFSLSIGKVVLSVKIIFLIEVLFYLFYCKREKILKYLYWGINFNIIIAIAQFIFYYISPELSVFIGPSNIAEMLWGQNATETFTNFYAIFKMVRVSGWSREAGFFASLVMVGLVLYIQDKEIKKKKFQYAMFIIGILISFSKASLLLIPLFFILFFQKYINKIPYWIGIIMVLIGGIGISTFLEKTDMYTNKNESLIHRFSGYSVITNMQTKELLVGVKKIQNLNEDLINKKEYLENIFKFDEFCGLPQLIVHNGIVITFLFLIGLKIFGYKTSDFWELTIITLTVDFFTSTSFVILGYFLIQELIFKRREQIELERKEKNGILIINDYFKYGGTEKYISNLRKILKSNGHFVSLLCFHYDGSKENEKIEEEEVYFIKNSKKFSKFNKILFNPFLYYKIKRKICQINPNKIILNNLFTSPITELIAVKGFQTFQIVHDYGILCPKSTCMKENGEICKGYQKENCKNNCTFHESKLSLKIKLLQLKIVERLRKSIIQKFISPSECLNQYLLESGYTSTAIPNPIEKEEANCSYETKKKDGLFLYVGKISEEKGIFEGVEVFKKFSEGKDVKLEIIGKADSQEKIEKLERIINKHPKIKYIGFLENEKTKLKIQQAYCLMAPSKWMENYPTTLLEATMNKTLAISSNRGGGKEIIQKQELIFDVLDENSFLNCLENSWNLSKEEYLKRTQQNYSKIVEENSFEKYYQKIMDVIQ